MLALVDQQVPKGVYALAESIKAIKALLQDDRSKRLELRIFVLKTFRPLKPLANAILIRLSASAPVDRFSFVFIDRICLGKNFAGLPR